MDDQTFQPAAAVAQVDALEAESYRKEFPTEQERLADHVGAIMGDADDIYDFVHRVSFPARSEVRSTEEKIREKEILGRMMASLVYGAFSFAGELEIDLQREFGKFQIERWQRANGTYVSTAVGETPPAPEQLRLF